MEMTFQDDAKAYMLLSASGCYDGPWVYIMPVVKCLPNELLRFGLDSLPLLWNGTMVISLPMSTEQ